MSILIIICRLLSELKHSLELVKVNIAISIFVVLDKKLLNLVISDSFAKIIECIFDTFLSNQAILCLVKSIEDHFDLFFSQVLVDVKASREPLLQTNLAGPSSVHLVYHLLNQLVFFNRLERLFIFAGIRIRSKLIGVLLNLIWCKVIKILSHAFLFGVQEISKCHRIVFFLIYLIHKNLVHFW